MGREEVYTELIKRESDKFLILDEKENYIGTIELIRFNPNDSMIEQTDDFSFAKVDVIAENREYVAEIENLSLLKEHRGLHHIEKVIYELVKYASKNKIIYFIALKEPVFYRTSKVVYKAPIVKLGKS